MNSLKALTFGIAASLLAVSPAAADVQLTMQNGRVSLVAKDVTVRQILTEWARVGHTKIVNVERIPGGLVSLELRNMPETQALDILLRSVSGYLAAPRPIEAANLSQFDRIVVMPTSAAPRAPVAGSPQTPTFQPPQFNQPPQADDDPDDVRAVPNVVVPGQNRGPVFNTFPQPQVVNPQGGPQGVGGVPPGAPQPVPTFPGAPTPGFGGVSVPGMIVAPPPQQPGQPGQPLPGQPGNEQPVRRPGGPENR